MKIQVLPDQVINKIAAGEVIERPSSVVRELVDNSLDAGATEIAVLIEDGGKRLIRVTDNGCGMVRDDAILAFERHATSKIKNFADLATVTTLGFRGEALAAIASVSAVRLQTKVQDQELGTVIEYRGGKLGNVAPCSGTVGTAIEVRNLFFNTPARRKFLRQPKTEELKIRQRLIQAALAHPAVRFQLLSDGRELLRLERQVSATARASALYPDCFAIAAEIGGIKVSGLIGHPALAQQRSDALVLLVNSRPVTDRLILRAVREGFDSMLKPREFPLGYLDIELDPTSVDVNVHPQKSEVRFQNDQQVFSAVKESVLSVVQQMAPAAQSAQINSTPLAANAASFQVINYARLTERRLTDLRVAETSFNFYQQQSAQAVSVLPNPSPARLSFSELKYIGQLFECYLLCEHDNKLVIVDMHAAHERVNFNMVRNRFRNQGVPTQQLLVPITVTLSAEGFEAITEQLTKLEGFGFKIEAFGDNVVLIRAAPTIVPSSAIEALIKELATDDLAKGSAIEEKIDHLSARIACHASIRSGRVLERAEVYALFAALDSAECRSACPHGRPIVVNFNELEIEHWFGRDR